MLQYYGIKCKMVTVFFYLIIIQFTIYKIITSFIADNKVVYQWVRRAMQLASDNSWARHRLQILSWRSQWIIIFEQGMAVSRKISDGDQCLLSLSSWLNTRSSTATCWMRSAASCCQQIVPILWLYFSRLLTLPSCQRLSGNSCNSLRAPESCLPVKFSWFYLIFTVISVSTVSQVKVAALSRWDGKIKTLVDGL